MADEPVTSEEVPAGVRAVARVLLLSGRDRLLLLQAEDPSDRSRWWVTPGGGLNPGESFEAAACRELEEETGLRLMIGAWVWTRRHAYLWEGRPFDQYERFFMARTAEERIAPVRADRYVRGHRWWSLEEIERSGEVFAPRRLGHFLAPILRGELPALAVDCGV